MEFQPRYNAYERNNFYADGRNMRHPPAGTVAQGLLKEDDAFYRGGDSANPIAKIPFTVDMALLERGRERYEINCTPCHGGVGVGDGIVVKRGFIPPPSFHDDRVIALSDGAIFRTISYGIRNMPAYAKQIKERDRWAIVAYVRALQKSQRATLQDVPESERAKLR
jgi:cytochrome c